MKKLRARRTSFALMANTGKARRRQPPSPFPHADAAGVPDAGVPAVNARASRLGAIRRSRAPRLAAAGTERLEIRRYMAPEECVLALYATAPEYAQSALQAVHVRRLLRDYLPAWRSRPPTVSVLRTDRIFLLNRQVQLALRAPSGPLAIEFPAAEKMQFLKFRRGRLARFRAPADDGLRQDLRLTPPTQQHQ